MSYSATPRSESTIFPMRLAATILFLLSTAAPAVSGEISEPVKGVSLTYQNNLWWARLDQQDILLSCMASACGGDCDVVLTMTPTGLRSQEFFDRFRNEINKNAIVKASMSGLNPVVVDKPAMVTIDGKEVSISSVRLSFLGSPTRTWMMVEEAPFGVVTLTCNSSEGDYEIARKTWLDLAKSIVIPRK
ncbi:hypothetical protein [Mesorhizobium sp.]|uniref:hypothetical protein n=1 Tax=Mesorhizobium sp. TaxID=1871066 RepID=UPI003BAC15CB